MAERDKKFEVDGLVTQSLPGTDFIVQVDIGGKDYDIKAHLGGKMRLHYIKVFEGDKVRVEISPYDLERGRIVYRY